jgi:hypothetical protein
MCAILLVPSMGHEALTIHQTTEAEGQYQKHMKATQQNTA